MLPIGWLVVAVVAAVLVSMWVTFTLTRLDRLHARVDAAGAALDAQLVRRAAALSDAVDAAVTRAGPGLAVVAAATAPGTRPRPGPVAELDLDRGVASDVGAGPDVGAVPDAAARGAVELARHAARQALEPRLGPALEGREATENAVGRAVMELVALTDELRAAELREAAARVQVARRFYNDAVRDTRALRARRMPRSLHLAGRVPLPAFFDIDDTVPPVALVPPPPHPRGS